MRILFLLLACFSCSGDDFKKVERLEGFRILGIVTSTPEVSPGATATLQLFVSDVKAAGRIINGTTVTCIDPGVAFGAEVKCDHDPSAVTGTYTIDTTTADMSSHLYTGLAAATLSVTVPASIFVGRSTREKFNGVSYLAIFNFQVDGEKIVAFKRIVATNRGSFNSNPTGTVVLLNGGTITASPTKNDKLKATSSAPEVYDYINVDGSVESRTEDLKVAWFVTQGRLDKPKSDINETTKYLGDSASGGSLVVAIVRDERGGVDVAREFFP